METKQTTLDNIAMARTDGEAAALAYIKEFGSESAREFAHQLMIGDAKPSPAMFGFVDGFANGVLK